MTDLAPSAPVIAPGAKARLDSVRLNPIDRTAVEHLLAGEHHGVAWERSGLGGPIAFLSAMQRVRRAIGVETHDQMLAWFNAPLPPTAKRMLVPPPPAGHGTLPPLAPKPRTGEGR